MTTEADVAQAAVSGGRRRVARVEYAIRRSTRARRVRVAVHDDGTVEVVLPPRGTREWADSAVRELRPWIDRRLAEVAVTQDRLAARGDAVPCLGDALRLVAEPGRTRAHRRGDALLVPAGDWRPAAERWFRREARAQLAPRVDAACATLGVRHAGITVRGQRTRWGSCSSRGSLSFNWRLLLAPAPVLDAVVWHECCHLVHLDHSPRFWALLAEHCPGWDDAHGWLREHGRELVL